MAVLITQACKKEVVRKTMEWQPCIWGDYFITHTPSLYSTELKELAKARIETLIKEVNVMLRDVISPLEKMQIIDALQRLGVDYHFEQEIDQELHQIHKKSDEFDDLHATSLQFRLLRQNRYNVSSDVFKKFKDEHGNFTASLAKDAKGLLSLYDAAYLGTLQDEILDEAIEFARSHLKATTKDLEPNLARQVLHSLKTPVRRRMTRLEARLYISIYEEDKENRNDIILELAKLDFHLLQMIHQEEIKIISMWWKELGLSSKLSFARDRIAECYFWTLGIYFEPHYSRARMMMAKVQAFLSLTDDIFDNYGTIPELQEYNEVIQRWDLDSVHQIEEYLQHHFLGLAKMLERLENELASEGTLYRVNFLREMIKQATGAWLEEAKLKDEEKILPFDEYASLALKTTAYPVLACASFVGMEEVASKDVFEWVIDIPKIVEAAAAICRFMDDVVDEELGTKGSHIVTTVGCYIKEHGTSIEVTCEKLLIMVDDAWKVINQEMINLKTMPTPILMRVLNLARMMETIYRDTDGYKNPIVLKDYISLLLIQPISF